jgi:hypothetical protein
LVSVTSRPCDIESTKAFDNSSVVERGAIWMKPIAVAKRKPTPIMASTPSMPSRKGSPRRSRNRPKTIAAPVRTTTKTMRRVMAPGRVFWSTIGTG